MHELFSQVSVLDQALALGRRLGSSLLALDQQLVVGDNQFKNFFDLDHLVLRQLHGLQLLNQVVIDILRRHSVTHVQISQELFNPLVHQHQLLLTVAAGGHSLLHLLLLFSYLLLTKQLLALLLPVHLNHVFLAMFELQDFKHFLEDGLVFGVEGGDGGLVFLLNLVG